MIEIPAEFLLYTLEEPEIFAPEVIGHWCAQVFWHASRKHLARVRAENGLPDPNDPTSRPFDYERAIAEWILNGTAPEDFVTIDSDLMCKVYRLGSMKWGDDWDWSDPALLDECIQMAIFREVRYVRT